MPSTNEDTNMMHRQQRQSSTSLRPSSSRGIGISTISSSNLSSDYSAPLTIIPRRCLSNRSRTSTTLINSTSPSLRCYSSNTSATLSSSSSSSMTTTSSSCPVLLSVLAWSVTLLLISSCLGIADAAFLIGHPLSKRSFMELQCKGIYDKSVFARLDRICEDCYNLFREPKLHTLCKKNCFTSDYFKGCVEVLLLQDEMPQIKKWIKHLHGADPGV